MIEGCFCSLKQPLLYQIIYSIVVGIIFSCFTDSLFILLFFALLSEVFAFCVEGKYYTLPVRTVAISSYVFGWILGRTVFEQEFCIVGWD
jgi:hypothetical protein